MPKPGEVRLKIMATGICGSDVHGYLGITGRRTPPMIMGHEFAGIVDALGDGVNGTDDGRGANGMDDGCGANGTDDGRGIDVGMRATVQPVVFCGSCAYCLRGETNLCVNRRFFGVMAENGSMAEYLCVPARLLVPLPDGMSMEQGAMAEAAAVAYGAVRRAGSLSGKEVAIVGAGPIGLLILQMAKAFGAERVYVSDLDDSRLQAARMLGAGKVVNPGREELSGLIPGGVDVSFEAVGMAPTVAQAIDLTKNGGTSVWVGNSHKIIDVDMQAIVTRRLNVLGSYIYTHQEFLDTVKLLNDGTINCDAIISHQYPLEKGVEVMADMAENPRKYLKVLLMGES